MKLSEFINQRLKELGMKRSDLINKHDLAWSTLSTIDRGGAIGNVTIEKLALALQCNRGDIQACLAEQNPLKKAVVSKKSLAKQKQPEADTVKEIMEEKPYITPEPEPEPEEDVDVLFPIETAVEETLADFKARMKDMCLYEFTAHGSLEEAKVLIAENLLEELLK